MLDYKSIIIKRYALGLSYKELAEELQIPVDWCVHSRISGAPILK